MVFFEFAADLIGKVVISIGARSLGDVINDARIKRRMERLVDDAVDRFIGQIEEYLRAEKVSDANKEMLITAICAKLKPLVDDPQLLFASDLDGARIFKQCHPKGELPQEIIEEQLGQFYSVLFPQIAHFVAGSRIALSQWQAEGYREEFKRLRQIADEISIMSAKVTEIPGAVVSAFSNKEDQESEAILREFSQTLLTNLLLRLDLSPLRAERALYGSLNNHFVIPAFCERRDEAKPIRSESEILNVLATPGARRIVHGGAGVGKTTWSLWLQSRLLQVEPSRLAIVLRLREITDIENHSLLELLRDRAGIHLRDSLTDHVLRKWYDAGQLVVILDGFDEVSEERRNAVEKWVKNLAVVVKKTALLITSRPLQSGHLEDLKKPWNQWDLLPFDEPRVLEFIERWHRFLPEGELSATERKVDSSALAHSFFNDPSLKPLADTPLMLGTLLFVHHRDKRLPSGRVDLYERYITAMLGLRDSGLGIQARSTKLTDKEKRRVLAHMALHFHLIRVNEVNDDTMRKLVAEALIKFCFNESVDRLLPALCERTGLLQGPGTWSFMHKTIGEFLVAELICDGTICLPDKRRLDRKELWNHRHEDTWTVVLFFWAGKTSPHELHEFISDLINEKNSDATLLALSLLDDQGDRLPHETQRELALMIIRRLRKWEYSSYEYSVCTTPEVPKHMYSECNAICRSLRGLSSTTSTKAFCKLFSKGVLTSLDVSTSSNYRRDILTVSCFWALGIPGSHVTLNSIKSIRHLSEAELALYSFDHLFAFSLSLSPVVIDAQQIHLRLTEWLNVFPNCRHWIPILLLGYIYKIAWHSRRERKIPIKEYIGPVIWFWRNEQIAEDWLQSSDECTGWITDTSFDLLNEINQILREDADEWGLSDEQHSDLMVWCEQLISRRTELKETSS